MGLAEIFEVEAHETSVRTEVVAGVTTFLTMSYIVVVNPDILKNAGMDHGALLTATCLAAALATWMMALFTNYPFALAPGMGLNAFFAFTVCMQKQVPWQTALGIVFVEGLIFVALTLLNVRELLVAAIPRSLKHAVGAGIGLFIAFIGLKNAGVVVDHPATLVTAGDFRLVAPFLAGVGSILTGALVARRVPGNLLWGMLLTAVLAWTFDPQYAWPTALVAAPPSPMPVLGKLDLGAVFALPRLELFALLLGFFFVDFFDTLGTLIGVSAKADLLDEDGNLPRAKGAFMADALGTTFGAVLGTSTVTTFIESASGVQVGGRTGLTAVVAGALFFLAPCFAPVLLAIPPYATAPALVLVGLAMMEGLTNIDFTEVDEAMPAFLCIIAMPYTFSISEGILLGVVSYTFLKLLTGKARELPVAMVVLTVIFMAKIYYGVG